MAGKKAQKPKATPPGQKATSRAKTNVEHAREAVKSELGINATPETLRQRRTNVMDDLWLDGRIGTEQRRAAHEIDLVFQAIASGTGLNLMKWETRVSGRAGGEDFATRLISAKARYNEWRADPATVRILRPQRTVADLVFDMVVHNYGLTQCTNLWKMGRKTVLGTVRESLFKFAELAGWVDGPFVCGEQA